MMLSIPPDWREANGNRVQTFVPPDLEEFLASERLTGEVHPTAPQR
jgi:hypothetical protein